MTQTAPFSATPNCPGRIAQSTVSSSCGSSIVARSTVAGDARHVRDDLRSALQIRQRRQHGRDCGELATTHAAAADRFQHALKLREADRRTRSSRSFEARQVAAGWSRLRADRLQDLVFSWSWRRSNCSRKLRSGNSGSSRCLPHAFKRL